MRGYHPKAQVRDFSLLQMQYGHSVSAAAKVVMMQKVFTNDGDFIKCPAPCNVSRCGPAFVDLFSEHRCFGAF
jgi:hypothetical protein